MSALSGILIGILFGFLLQKGQVLKYDNQIAAMKLSNLRIFKFMMSGMATASIGLYLLNVLNIIELTHEPFSLFGIIVGGVIFGIGWGILGYCPGTTLGALGEGSIDALFGFFGLITGSIIYSFFYPMIGNFNSDTIIGTPSLYDILPGILAPVTFILIIIGVFKFFENKGL